MKHTKKVTVILISMFIITQLIGLAVINAYSPKVKTIFNQTSGEFEEVQVSERLPYGMQPPELKPATSLSTIIIAFIIAIALVFLLTKFKAAWFLRIWFFVVVILAIGLTLNTLFFKVSYGAYIALAIAIPVAFFKVFKRNIIIHNATELLVYPGIAAVFAPILSIWTAIALLLLISFYDIWAVWKSGFMQKMAKFQINELKFFAGFFVPYADKKTREMLKKLKEKFTKKQIEKKLKSKKIKVNLAILGGGDVVFPIIVAGVVLRTFGWFPAIFISLGATLALLWLQVAAKKGKWYPAMPFITSGILFGFSAGMIISTIIATI